MLDSSLPNPPTAFCFRNHTPLTKKNVLAMLILSDAISILCFIFVASLRRILFYRLPVTQFLDSGESGNIFLTLTIICSLINDPLIMARFLVVFHGLLFHRWCFGFMVMKWQEVENGKRHYISSGGRCLKFVESSKIEDFHVWNILSVNFSLIKIYGRF